ncbi:MAG TPA: glycosyltransferase, partial [Chryseolinea sp.]
PSFFLMGTIALLVLPLINIPLFLFGITCFALYLLAIFFHSLIENRDLAVAFLSIPAALCQLFGYGSGFLREKLQSSG